MKKYTIPPKDRIEWGQIVTAKVEHRFQNFVLQMKSADYKRQIEEKTMSIEEAIDDLYKLCEKYTLAVQKDFKEIFKEW